MSFREAIISKPLIIVLAYYVIFSFRGGKAQEFKHHDLLSTLFSHTAVDAIPFHDFSFTANCNVGMLHKNDFANCF
jgi:hypothetical protein